MSSVQEDLIATNQFQVITNLANTNGDSIISATASIMEAMTHMRRSNSTESIEKAQRALATARSAQLDPAFQRVPQLASMMHFVDVSCSLQQFDPSQATLKMQAMHAMLDSLGESESWTGDSSLLVPVSNRTAKTLQESSIPTGLLQINSTGATCIYLEWLPKGEIYALGHLLSGAVVLHRNAMDRKSEQYLKEAKRMIGGNYCSSRSINKPS